MPQLNPGKSQYSVVLFAVDGLRRLENIKPQRAEALERAGSAELVRDEGGTILSATRVCREPAVNKAAAVEPNPTQPPTKLYRVSATPTVRRVRIGPSPHVVAHRIPTIAGNGPVRGPAYWEAYRTLCSSVRDSVIKDRKGNDERKAEAA